MRVRPILHFAQASKSWFLVLVDHLYRRGSFCLILNDGPRRNHVGVRAWRASCWNLAKCWLERVFNARPTFCAMVREILLDRLVQTAKIPRCFAKVSPSKAEDFRRKRSEEHTSELQSRGHLVCR